jgi:hypothetical protein
MLERAEKALLATVSLLQQSLAAGQIPPDDRFTWRSPTGGCGIEIDALVHGVREGSQRNGRNKEQQSSRQGPQRCRITTRVMLDDDAGVGIDASEVLLAEERIAPSRSAP